MRKIEYPVARMSDIVVQELDNETLVYDLKTNKAVCLNETSAIVWRLCDGKNDIAEISNILSAKTKTLVSEELIEFALYQLQNERLLEHELECNGRFGDMSRREVIKKIGLSSAIVLPLVGSIIAPSAAQAQSSCIDENMIISTSSNTSAAAFDVDCQLRVGECCNNIVETDLCQNFLGGVICSCICR